MIVKNIHQTPAFTAGDNTQIREILHPKNEDLSLTYSLAYATLPPDEASRPHQLQSSTEVYVILEGKGEVFIDDESRMVGPGDVVFIPAGANQYIVNAGRTTLCFLCVVSPPWKKADEIVR